MCTLVPTNLCTSCPFVGTLILLMVSIFDKRGLAPWLLTKKLRYSFYGCPENDFPAFTFNPVSAIFCKKFSNAFIISVNISLLLLVHCIGTCVLYQNLQRVSIFSLEINWGCYIRL